MGPQHIRRYSDKLSSESLKLIGFKLSMPLFNTQILPPQSNLVPAVLLENRYCTLKELLPQAA